MEQSDKDQLHNLVQQKAVELSEHFDSVQVFVTLHRGGEEVTLALDAGKGNFYARLGQVNEWLRIQDQYQRHEAIRRDNQDRD